MLPTASTLLPAPAARQTALCRGAVFLGVTGPLTLAPPASGAGTLEGVSGEQRNGSELGRFLRARRAEVTPAEAGLPTGTGLRRTPGLRREELATLAGVSVNYYTRLERGKETRPSPSVVDAIARALRLDETELEHLHDLAARAARHLPERPAAPSRSVPPGVKLLLESLRPNPAYVVSRTMDVLAANPGGLRLYSPK